MSQHTQEQQVIDMGRFSQVFFEECGEHLAEMEQILMSLADGEPDDEQLNAIFRAAHSIKGGAGMFGFQDMTIVTHVLESLLDKLRTHEMPFSTTMIDLFLEAGDVISMQLAGHRDGSEVSQEAVDLIRTKLENVIEGKSTTVTETLTPPAETQLPTIAPAPSTEHRYELTFTPDPDIFKRGVRLENLLADLGGLGTLTVQAQVSDPDDFSSFDPEECLTSWRLSLETGASEAEIRDIFEFVADEDQLQVVDVTDNTGVAENDAIFQESAPFIRQAESDTPAPATCHRS